MNSGQGDVRSDTGARDHLSCLAENQACSILVGSSARGCAETATYYLVPRGSRRSLMQQPLISSGIRLLPTG